MIAGMPEGYEAAVEIGALGVGLLVVAAYMPRFIRYLRRGPAIDTAALRGMLAAGEDLLVLDVRAAGEFLDAHIVGALNVPLEDLARWIDADDGARDRPVAVICRTNVRAGKAAIRLRAVGFTNTLLVRDGMVGWRKNDFPTRSA